MPTSYTDQFFMIDPFNVPDGTSVTFVTMTLLDFNDDDLIDNSSADTVGGTSISTSYPGDIVDIDIGGGTIIRYTGTTFYLSNGSRAFTPTDGQVLQNGVITFATGAPTPGPLDVGDLGPPCFAAGTRIETERGMTPIEQIKVGDLVRTLDHGLQPVRWCGSRGVPALDKRAPIRFAPGAMGNVRELLVSPQHKILVSGWRAELFFGEDEVLVAAVHLVNADTIHRAPRRHVMYHHLMFDAHEILLADGVPTESFFPGDYVLQDDNLRDEVLATFPEMLAGPSLDWTCARRVLKSQEAKVLRGDYLQAA